MTPLNLDFESIESLEKLLTYSSLIKELLDYSSPESIKQGYPMLSTQGIEFVGVLLDGVPVGLAQYCLTTNLENYKCLRLDEIIVAQEHRKKGIGRSLIKKLEEQALKNNCSVIFLATGIRNTTAQKFYFQSGFAIGSLYLYKKLTDA